jgi:hypothetical protein
LTLYLAPDSARSRLHGRTIRKAGDKVDRFAQLSFALTDVMRNAWAQVAAHFVAD